MQTEIQRNTLHGEIQRKKSTRGTTKDKTYAKGITKKLGLNEQGGVIRVSMAHYNTIKEMDRLINILNETI